MNQSEQVAVDNYLLTLVYRSWISSTMKMEVIVPPKRLLTKYLHGAISQKTAFFIVIAVKTSNLAKI
jgi:hypothetical protein